MSRVDSNAFSLVVVDLVDSALGMAAGGLAPGEWTTFLGPPTEIGKWGISWQAATAFWDPNHREFQFMAKGQNGGSASHWIYSELPHAWRSTALDLVPGQLGHIWNRTFDPDSGDYYYLDLPLESDFVRRMDRAVENEAGSANDPWTQTSAAPAELRRGAPETDIGYHPNLFGQSDPGVLVWGAGAMAAWRKDTETWELMQTYGGGEYWGSRGGAGHYLPGFDRLVLGTGGQSQNFLLVDAGSDGSLATTTPILEESPILVRGGTSAHLPWAKLVVHPRDDSVLMLLEAGPPNRVWTNAQGGTADGWVLETYTHPFSDLPLSDGDAGSWTLGSVSTHAVLWGMAYGGQETGSILWKPD